VKTLEQINQEFIESCIPTEPETQEPLDENDQWLQDLFKEVNSGFEFREEPDIWLTSDQSDGVEDDFLIDVQDDMADDPQLVDETATWVFAYADEQDAVEAQAQPAVAPVADEFQEVAEVQAEPAVAPVAADEFPEVAEVQAEPAVAPVAANEFPEVAEVQAEPAVAPVAVDEPQEVAEAQTAPATVPVAADIYAQPAVAPVAVNEFPRTRVEEEKVPAQQNEQQSLKAKKSSRTKLISDIIFYAVIAFILVATLLYSGRTNNGFQLFGYSGFTVLTRSMQSEIPQGALVITKEVDPNTIEVGDDITFIRSDNATVTHRVVNIIDDYENSGYKVFQTQGIENPDPDPDYVYAGNIIGVVKYSIPELGFFLSYVAENIGFVFIILGGILVAAIALGKVFTGSKNGKSKSKVSVA